MSSATIALPRPRTQPRIPLGFVVAALVIAVGIGAFVGARVAATSTAPAAETTKPVIHRPAFPVQPGPTIGDYRQLVSNLAAAEDRHDYAALARFRNELDRLMTGPMIGTVYMTHAQLVADAEAAANSGDTRHWALFEREIRKLCGAEAIQAKLDFCN